MSLKHIEIKTFDELMSLEEVRLEDVAQNEKSSPSKRLFRSLVRPYKAYAAPGVFGGHVLAQASFAASKTVLPGFICHNIHGYFILPGQRDIPFYYHVEEIRNGTNFSVRQVKVYQNSEPSELFRQSSICFIAIVSLKKPTPRGSLGHQRALPPQFRPESPYDNLHLHHDLAPDIDTPQWTKLVTSGSVNYKEEHHPIEVRKVDMKDANDNKQVFEKVQIHYFKSHYPISDDPNMHFAAFLYVSDRNSLFTILNLQNEEHLMNKVASIDHAFVFHDLGARLTQAWHTMETFSSRASDGRGLYQGHIYDESHNLVCSFMQDGVVRVFEDEKDGFGESKI